MSARRAALALVLVLAGAAACGPEPVARARRPRSGASLYQLGGTWTDQTGASVGLDVFAGRPVVIGMFYGTCESSCPLLLHDVERLETELAGPARERLGVVFVTFDPERDTPAKLAEYAARRGLRAERWRLLRGDPEQVRQLAAVLGVRYRALPDGNIGHSMQIALLDTEGRLDLRVEGLGQPIAELAQRVSALAQEEEP